MVRSEIPADAPNSRRFSRRMAMVGGVGLASAALVKGSAFATEEHVHDTSQTFLAVPERAKPRLIPPSGYLVEPVGSRPGAYHITDGLYTTVFFVTARGVVVVDAPAQLGTKTLDAIRSVTDKPVTHAIYSHSHNDHIDAMGMYGSDVQYIAHEDSIPYLRRKGRVPMPSRVVPGSRPYALRVDDLVLTLTDEGRAHQPGNLFIWSPVHQVLMTVDVVFPRWAPLKNLAIATDPVGLRDAMAAILRYPVSAVVGGHFDRPADRADVAENHAYLQDLFEAAAEANASVDFGEATRGVDPQNRWAQVRAWWEAIDQKCFDLMVAKDWEARLGGADVFLRENCFVAAEALRIDG